MIDTADSLVLEARRQFLAAGLPDASLDARLLVSNLLDLSSAHMISHGGDAVEAHKAESVRSAIERRLAHEPVHRILGERLFFGLKLALSPDTLEPRPDTEILVERMLPVVSQIATKKGACRVLDLGTGTGAICLALANADERVTGTGVDLSPGALETACRNAKENGLESRFIALHSNWFSAVDGVYDVIVSNPPYISSSVIPSLSPDVRFYDPLLALDGGDDGLDAYRIIAQGATSALEPNGVIGVEIGFDQKQEVCRIFEAQGFILREAATDLGGNDRVLVFALSR